MDETLSVEDEDRRRAAEELLSAEPVPVPETVEELESRDSRRPRLVSVVDTAVHA